MKGTKITLHWKGALLGTAVGVVTMVCGCAVGAGLMAKGAVDVANLDIWAAGILMAMGLAGCMTARCGGGNLEALVAALGELVVLMGLNGALNGGKMEGFAITALALSGACGGAILLGLRKGKMAKRRHRPRKNR